MKWQLVKLPSYTTTVGPFVNLAQFGLNEIDVPYFNLQKAILQQNLIQEEDILDLITALLKI